MIEKEVIVEKEVIKEVPVEKQVIVEKEVVKEVVKEVPKEIVVTKETIKEVPVETIKEVVVEKEVIKIEQIQVPVDRVVVETKIVEVEKVFSGYGEAPQLTQQVQGGVLPAIEDRLPKQPRKTPRATAMISMFMQGLSIIHICRCRRRLRCRSRWSPYH